MATARLPRPGIATTATAAFVALLIRLAVRTARFDRVTATVRWLASMTRREATTDEVLRVLCAVDAGAAWVPVRIACLERSLTALVLLAARRSGVTWQMGVRTPPLAAHAWLIDPHGEPIGEPSTIAAYRPLITISAPTVPNRSTT
ncbi:MAG: lasso peptide biosynthesis B2 protein [Sciscionella sp.]